MNLFYLEERLGRKPTRGCSIYMFCLPLGWSQPIFKNYYQYYVGVLVILMRLAQLSELPEDPEPSSSLGACILRIIRLRLLASLSGCAIIQFFIITTLNWKSSLSFSLHEIGLWRLKKLLCKVISVVHCNAISLDYYGIEYVKLKSKQPSAQQATIETPGFLISLILIARLAFWSYLFTIRDFHPVKSSNRFIDFW